MGIELTETFLFQCFENFPQWIENAYKMTNENAVASQLDEMMNKFNQIINPTFIKIEMVKSNALTNLEKKS